jgi:hypothetical protein
VRHTRVCATRAGAELLKIKAVSWEFVLDDEDEGLFLLEGYEMTMIKSSF